MEKSLAEKLAGYDEAPAEPFDVFSRAGNVHLDFGFKGRVECRCPVTHEQETLWLRVKLVAGGDGLHPELVSWQNWLLAMAGRDLGLEGMCQEVYEALHRLCRPLALTVKVHTGYRIGKVQVRRTNLLTEHKKS